MFFLLYENHNLTELLVDNIHKVQLCHHKQIVFYFRHLPVELFFAYSGGAVQCVYVNDPSLCLSNYYKAPE